MLQLLTCKHQPQIEVTCSDKQSSLFHYKIFTSEKSFITQASGPSSKVIFPLKNYNFVHHLFNQK